MNALVMFGGLSIWAGAAGAQAPPRSLHVAAQAVMRTTWLSPVPGGSTGTEVLVEQPMLMAAATAAHAQLRLDATLNLEGLTMPDGGLTLGAWGEGFMDRRHPHTYAHELMLSGRRRLGGSAIASLSLGKGFVPFGTDDPMSRPTLRFPVNHHWSQILERAVSVAGLRWGLVAVEGALFNGDEPERPSQWPRIARFGDSWAARLTVWPAQSVETQVSYAAVKSPEHRPGAGTPQAKWSASVRVDRALGGSRLYVLTEWARTSEANGFFVFSSVLTEAQLQTTWRRIYLRWEHTERPEEERLFDPFRSRRPHLEDAILGKTAWTVQTAGFAAVLRPRFGLLVEPVVEGSFARAAEIGGGLFRVAGFYGRSDFWSLSLGVRLRAGRFHRMGRYGVLADVPGDSETEEHHHDSTEATFPGGLPNHMGGGGVDHLRR